MADRSLRVALTPACWVGAHRMAPFGPPPRYQDFRPPIERCQRCGALRMADGTRLTRDQRRRVLPYPADPGDGWVGHGHRRCGPD